MLLLAPAGRAVGDDWPAWRGPNRDGICAETGLLQEWPKDGPVLLWKAQGIGEGYSGPAIVGDRLYTMGDRDGKEWVFALDLTKEGKQVWATPIGAIRHKGSGFPGPRATPSIDGDRLYTLGINGDLVCMKVDDGSILWRHDLVKDFGGKIPNWGYAESPLIDGPWVVCTPGEAKATMVALDKLDGKPIWQSKAGDPAAYASIIKFQVGDVKQYVTLTAKGVIGVRASDGEFLWRYDKPANKTANCTTCVAFRQTVFGASAYGTGGGLAWVHETPDGFVAKELYFTKKMQNHHGGMILRDGNLYGSSNNELNCLNYRDGKVRWSSHEPGKCSVLYADGRIYCRDEKGPISLVEATPEGYHLKGRFDQPDRSHREAWPHLVIAGKRLFVRDQDVLLCYDVAGK
jgi:outer membrane protein assembly factor BamB